MKFIFFIFFIQTSVAFTPSVESLFRNSRNKEVNRDLSTVTFEIENIGEKENQNVEGENSGKDRYYLEVSFFNEDNKIRFLQAAYTGLNFKDREFVYYKYYNNIFEKLNSNNLIGRELVYSILMYYVLNNPDGMVNFLSRNFRTFQKNSELINQKKMSLLEAYAKYLEEKKNNPNSNSVSPLEVSDNSIDIKSILNEEMYRKSLNVKLIRNEQGFFWHIGLGKFEALFTNEDRILKNLSYKDDEMSFSLNADQLLLFNGVHELPKSLFLNFNEAFQYRIKFISLSHRNISKRSIIKKIQQFKKDNTDQRFNFPFIY